MDEPQISNTMDVSDQEKSNFDDVLNDASIDAEKPMEVDSSEPFASTSSVHETFDEPIKQQNAPEEIQDIPFQSEIQEAGNEIDEASNEEENPAESGTLQPADETLEQSNFDDTFQSKQSESYDYTEKSINISQISVDQNNDSNDAFDALKLSESNMLEQSKDEDYDNQNEKDETGIEDQQEEEADEDDSNAQDESTNVDSQVDKTENLPEDESEKQADITDLPEEEQGDECAEKGDEQEEEEEEEDEEKSPKEQDTPMETDQQLSEEESMDRTEGDATVDQTDDQQQDEIDEESHTAEASTEMDDAGDETGDPNEETGDPNEESGYPNDVESSTADSGERTEEQEEEETTETTNEGEGIDENVCLFGDAERELTDADKERVVQPQEASEEEELESVTGEKEVVEGQEAPAEGDEAMEVDVEPAEKEGEGEGEDEIEETETEEIIEPEPEEEIVDHSVPLKENEIREVIGELTEETCLNCENSSLCQYRLLEDTGEIKYLCTFGCVTEHREDNPDKYTLTQKKVYIYEIPLADFICSKCNETKSCKYHYRVTIVSTVTKEPQPAVENVEEEVQQQTPQQPVIETVQSTEDKYLCDDNCLQEFIGGNTDKYIVKEVQRRSTRVREAKKRVPAQEEPQQEIPKIVARTDAEVEAARLDRDESFIRRCNQCFHVINFTAKTIQWETLDFCNEKCLGLYQNLIGATCVTCNDIVNVASIGKLCVRFGFDLKQFCSTKCLDDFKKTIKQCALCQTNLIDEENVVIAQVGDKRIYRDFCNQQCLKKYENILNPKKKQSPHVCSVCNNKKVAKIEVTLDDNVHRFCSNPCYSAFKFVNNVSPDQCDMCTKYFERKSTESFTIYQITESKIFCTRVCMNMFICKSREIWQCNWCKVSKYNYDMIQMNFGKIRMCSLNCLSLHEVSLNALTPKRTKCSHCKLLKQPQYHLTMSDTSIRSFCTYQCAIGFQGMFSKNKIGDDPSAVVPAGTAKRIKPSTQAIEIAKQQASVPIIARVQSLSTGRRERAPRSSYVPNRSRSPIPVPELTVTLERLSDLPQRVKISSLNGTSSWTPIPTTSRATTPTRVENKTQVITIPPLPKQISNKSTMCHAITLNKAVEAIPHTAEAECQTDDFLEQKYIVPVPIPIFVPQPMYMYNLPTPIPVPIPLPIPIPVFIPTTRNSSQGIMKEIKKIQDKMPTDPYEAELLMMAEMVAGDRKREETDSDSDDNNEIEYADGMENNFNEDLVQMAFKMASGNDYDDPPVDLENEMTANTISQNAHGYDDMDPQALHHHQLLLLHQQREAAMQANRGRKRMQPIKQNNARNTPNKRIKREMESMQPEIPREPAEKPDANMCLKYTFGVNAWKQWVATKNADLEKSSIRRRPIKSEILQLTADELNYSLCMFVKEVRKPNGSEYAPDTIYYLVLGIQQYLYENGRIDNIFTDRYYEQFTDCLDEVAKKFSVLYNDSQYIVTRVEEEHLWECKQLGAHSPHVLLSTLMFFNTKHFNLVTVDEHMELSFSHIMKHWKRNPNQPGAAKMPGSRNVLLRFYPPQSSLEANSRKKKVYEQQENEENPLRCPVKLYEFYLSKCPESVKTRNDVFYLQPERSCVPDSPVWYSTQPLSRDALSKMLHRVKMVKEINIALLTS